MTNFKSNPNRIAASIEGLHIANKSSAVTSNPKTDLFAVSIKSWSAFAYHYHLGKKGSGKEKRYSEKWKKDTQLSNCIIIQNVTLIIF